MIETRRREIQEIEENNSLPGENNEDRDEDILLKKIAGMKQREMQTLVEQKRKEEEFEVKRQNIESNIKSIKLALAEYK